jgi:CDP-glucose 4,6-dehydratase
MRREETSNTYNFGPGVESKLTVREMAEMACEQWQGSLGLDIQPDPNSLPESGLLWLSSDLANQELGWSNRFEAEEAIRWSIEWERESMKSSPLEALDIQIKNFFGELQ